MSKNNNPLEDYVFSLSDDEFDNLLIAIDKKIDKQRYGYTTFEEAAIHYDRTPICPKCSSSLYHLDGKMRITKDIDVTIVIHLIHYLVIQYLMEQKYHYINLLIILN